MKKTIMFILFVVLTVSILIFGARYFNVKRGLDAQYVPGEISLRFKDDVKEEQAITLLNSYDLKLQKPDLFFRYYFIALNSNKDNINEFEQPILEIGLTNLKTISMIKHSDSQTPLLMISFKPRATTEDVKRIMKISDDLYIETFSGGPSATYIVNVPIGMEQQVSEKLRNEQIIEIAMQNDTIYPDPSPYQF